MKNLRILFLLLILTSPCYVYANTFDAKEISLPFYNELINAKDHTGLYFSYDMTNDPVKRVICTVLDAYKTWLEYSDESSPRQSKSYGHYQKIIFTNKGKDTEINDKTDMYHTDIHGIIKINEVLHQHNNSLASCFYEVDPV